MILGHEKIARTDIAMTVGFVRINATQIDITQKKVKFFTCDALKNTGIRKKVKTLQIKLLKNIEILSRVFFNRDVLPAYINKITRSKLLPKKNNGNKARQEKHPRKNGRKKILSKERHK